MPLDKTPYQPEDAHLSEPITVRAYIAADQSFARLTPLMRDVTNPELLVEWDGSAGKAVAMSARASDAPAVNEKSAVYVAGGFRISAVEWPVATDTDEEKCAAFLGSAIYVDDEA